MKIDNETDDDIDYNQTSGGGADDDDIRAGDVDTAIEGSLPPGAEVLFSPAGTVSYRVRLTDAAAPEICCEVTFSDPDTAITVHALAPCQITAPGATVGPCQAS